MDSIHIPQLLTHHDRSQTLAVEEFLDGLPTLTPVKGRIAIKHQGNYLDLSTQAAAIVTLTCDRCLQNYNYRLQTTASECIWLQDRAASLAKSPIEEEIAYEDLVETLPAQGHFNPSDWLYQQLCLELPLHQHCGQTCPGIPLSASEPESTAVETAPIDSRWASLAALRDRLPSSGP